MCTNKRACDGMTVRTQLFMGGAVPAYLLGRLLLACLQVSFSLGAQQRQDGGIGGLLHCTAVCPYQLLPDLPEHLGSGVRVPAHTPTAVCTAVAWCQQCLC